VVPPFERDVPLIAEPDEVACGDVTSLEDCLSFIGAGDTVLHLAGVVSICAGDEEKLWAVNVQGTGNVARACLARGAARMVYVSSVHAFPEVSGTVDEKTPISEEDAYGCYGRSKAAATLHVRAAMDEGLDAVIVHPSGVIGPYDSRLMNNMTQTLVRLATGKMPALVSGAYDFVDVRDVAYGIVEAALKGRRGESYILSGQWTPVPQLARLLKPLVNVRLPRVSLPLWLVALFAPLIEDWARARRRKPIITRYSIHTLGTDTRFCHEKATRELSYRPRSLAVTLRDTVQWLREQKVLA
jgi:dihydroflavonol-4-reductase